MDESQRNVSSRTMTVAPNTLDNDSHLFYLLAVPCLNDNCNSSIFGTNQRHSNNSTNRDDENSASVRPTAELVVLGILAGSTILVTIAGNFVVLFSFLLESSIRHQTNYFLASLAVSDLLIGTVSMPFYTVYLLAGKSWPLGEVLCDLWLSVDYTVCLSSIYTVLCITIDRFCSIKIPAKYRKWRTERKVTAIIAVVWTIPFLVFFPSIFGWQYFVGVRTVAEGKCYVQYMESAVFNVLLQLGYFWITMVVMCSLYSGIYQVALNLQRKSEAKWRQTASLVSVAGQAVTQLGIQLTNSQPPHQHQNTDKSKPVGDVVVVDSRPEGATNDNTRSGFHSNDDADRCSSSSECSSDTDAGEVKGGQTTTPTTGPKIRPYKRFQEKTSSKRKLSWKRRHSDKKKHLQVKSIQQPSVLPIVCSSPLLPLRSTIPPLPGNLVSAPRPSRIPGGQNSVRDGGLRVDRTLSKTLSLKASGSGRRLHNGLDVVVRERCASERTLLPTTIPTISSCLSSRACISRQPRPEDGQEQDFKMRCTSVGHNVDDVSFPPFNRRGSSRRRRRSSSAARHQRTNNSLERIESQEEAGKVSDGKASIIPDSPVWIRRSSIVLKPHPPSSPHPSTDSICTTFSARFPYLDYDAEAGQRRPNGGSNYEGVEASVENEPAVETTTASFGTFFRRRRAKFRKTSSTAIPRRRSRPTSRLFCLRWCGGGGGGGPAVAPNRSPQGVIETPGAISSRAPSKRENRARKALRTITIILGAFVVCWTPWHILSMIYGFCPSCVDADLYDVSYWLCYLNSPINPFCYAFVNPQFKKTFLRIFRLDWRRT